MPAPIATTGPAFSPQRFFAGRTEGTGELKTLFSPRHTVRVHGSGRVDADGTLILDQSVDEQGKPAKQREWRIHETAPGRYTGTLSDATGPVVANVTGNRLDIRFEMKGGLAAEQWLDLAPDGRSARNHMSIRKLGIVVATLNETIRKP